MKESELATTFLISGSGTTAEAAIKAEVPGIRPVLVIASRSGAEGLKKAQALGIPTAIISRKDYPSSLEFGEALLAVFDQYRVDFVSQNGWLAWTPREVVQRFSRYIVNQHPASLDPGREAFGGRYMYGAAAVCAFLAYSWVVGKPRPQIEATTHHVTPEYDQGLLIRVQQLPVPTVNEPVTIADLQAKPAYLRRITLEVQKELLPVEHHNVIETLKAYGRSEVDAWWREDPLISEEHLPILAEAKQLAIKLFLKG